MSKKIFKLEIENRIGVVTFAVPGAAMNTWTDPAIEDLFHVTDEIGELADSGKLDGVLFISGNERSFITGADLNTLASKESWLEFKKDIEIFQIALNDIAAIKIPTLAAISGFCLGGGLELALACQFRMAKESGKPFIGLTETAVGLFPAGGGTQRLTRLIGVPAVDMIMSGKMVTAEEALQLGIVDAVVAPDGDLLDESKKMLSGIIAGTCSYPREEHDFSDIDNVIELARAAGIKRGKGRELPGVKYALDTIRDGIKLSLHNGLELEKKNFIKTALNPQSKGTINTFFLKSYSDKPLKMATTGFQPKPIKKLGVLGFGTMGRGVVIDMLRYGGVPVVVKDEAAALENGRKSIEKILNGMYEKKRLKTKPEELMKNFIPVTEYGGELSDVDILVEAIFEDPDIKAAAYSELTEVMRSDAIIVTNTSFLSVSDLAKNVKNPERFAGMHFFSPVWLMQMVEIVKGETTSRETVDNLLNFAGLIRKRPVVCKDSEGFVVNAVLDPFMSNSLQYLEEGADPGKIESAFLSFGMPMGPLRLNDSVGLDVSHHINQNRGIEQKTLKNLFEAGYYGFQKNGKGLFKEDGSFDETAMSLVHKREPRDRTEEEMVSDVLTCMVTVGKRLLDEGIVDDVRMIDIGMIWGAGYPSDRGGPMKWADLTGLSESLFGERFYK